MKKIIYIILTLIACCLAFSCDQQAAGDISVSEVKITLSADTLLVGETMELTVEVLPAEAANKEYDLSVNEDGKNIVEIIDNTHIKGLKAGSAYITATAKENGKSHSVKVTVKASPNTPDDGPDGPDGPDDPDDPNNPKPSEDAFEFAVEVDGIDVDIDITANVDSAYYVVCIQSYLFDNSTEMGTTPKEYITDDINYQISEGASLSDLLITGNHGINYYHDGDIRLLNNEYYTVFAIVVKENPNNTQGWEFGTSYGETEFKTQARGSYEGEENILALDIIPSDVTITVNVDASTDEPYYIACMTERNYFNDFIQFEEPLPPCYTDTDIMSAVYNQYNGNVIYSIHDIQMNSNDQEIIFEGLKKETSYCIIAFCYDGENMKPTTPLYLEKVKTLAESTGSQEPEEIDIAYQAPKLQYYQTGNLFFLMLGDYAGYDFHADYTLVISGANSSNFAGTYELSDRSYFYGETSDIYASSGTCTITGNSNNYNLEAIVHLEDGTVHKVTYTGRFEESYN